MTRKHLICVGISPEITVSLQAYFESSFETVCFANAAEFTNQIKDLHPVLMFLNSQLPDFDNCQELCIALRSYIDTETVPLIIITQNPILQEKIMLYQAGLIDGYFSDEVNIEELTAYANVFLQRQALQEELEEKNKLLSKYSITDELMQIFNRRYLIQRLNEELSRIRRYNYPLSIMMIDIDFFKKINDTLGHSEGDNTLRQMAILLKKSLRGVDIICRYGGEEIVAILPHTNQGGAEIVAERLRKKVEEFPFGKEGSPHQVTISIGVISFNSKIDVSFDQAMQALDKQLYLAKNSGRNRVCISEYQPGE